MWQTIGGDSIYDVLIASYLEPEYIERIRRVDESIKVIYEPELLAPPRYPADHKGDIFQRTDKQELRWRELLSKAEILFDFDQTHLEDLPELAPNVKWIQATSSGIGHFVKNMKYDTRMPNTIFTTARGVHAQPLTEFCLMVMMMFNKRLLQVLEDQKRKHWQRYAGTDLRNKTLVIIGVGRVGQEIARLCQCLGMYVIGIKRDITGIEPSSLNVDELYGPIDLHKVLKRAEYLVLIAPHTPETEGMISKKELELMPKGGILINIGRGALVNQGALIDSLQSGHLGGAGLDVFEVEPLPKDSPLWAMENVIVSPHSGSTSDYENNLITDLFCLNLHKFITEQPLINKLDTEKLF